MEIETFCLQQVERMLRANMYLGAKVPALEGVILHRPSAIGMRVMKPTAYRLWSVVTLLKLVRARVDSILL